METNPLIRAALLFIITACGTASAQGIKFEQNKPWADVLAMGKTADKLVFIDVYTDWCGPCEAMDKTVFLNANVAKLYDDKFINYKLDAEKGIGPQLSKKYHIVSYPTYLFVDSKGTLIYRANGYMEPNDFMKEAANAQREKKEPTTLLQLDSMFATHQTDTAFLYTYLQRRTKLRQDNADLLDYYCTLLDTTSQGSTRTLQLIADNGNFLVRSLQVGPAFKILLNHQDQLKQLNGAEDISAYIGEAQRKTLAKAIAQKNENLLTLLLALNNGQVMEYYDDRSDDIFVMKYFYGTRQFPQYLATATKLADMKLMKLPVLVLEKKDSAILADVTASLKDRLANIPEKAAQTELATYRHTQTIQVVRLLTDICNDILKIPGNTAKVYANGKRWMKHAVDLTERDTAYYKNVYPFTLHTYAVYLYKTGDKANAITLQTKALDLMTNLASTAELDENINALAAMQSGKPINYTLPAIAATSVSAKTTTKPTAKTAAKPTTRKKA